MTDGRHAQRATKAVLLATVAALLAPAALVSTASASTPRAAVVVKPPEGAGKPVAATGIGTKAALDNPRCTTGEQYGVYGRFDTSVVGGGGICVRPWKASEDNGGATSRGVTGDAIKVVAVIPNAAQQAAAAGSSGAAPTKRVGGPGTYEDAVHDWLLSQLPHYETWGRDIEVVFVTSTGDDEAAQRADAVAIKAMKPFAVVNFNTAGLDVLEAEIASSKTLVMGYGTSPNEALAQAPFRWGGTDTEASAVNSAEVIGKQLVGKKAEFAGSDEIKGQTRKLGVVSIEDSIDMKRFKKTLGEYKGKVVSEATYPAGGGTFGNPTVAAEQAPVIVGRMKEAGITTVALFTDVAMNKALMTQATAQEWFPEWFLTGSAFYDIAVLARGYPADQSRHAFGIVSLGPWLQPDPDPAVAALSGLNGALDWYWGPTVGTSSIRATPGIGWLLSGIHTAGPKLTPKTFEQGMFSMPATGGSASDNPLVAMSGFGKTTGLPYLGYIAGGLDFAPAWMDPDTEGPSAGTGSRAKHVSWYVDDGKRYKSGDWPTKKIAWFDKNGSIFEFTTRPASVPAPVAAPPCDGCPASGATSPTAGTPSPTGFTAEASDAVSSG